MPGSDLGLLIDAARAAGDLAKSFWKGENRVWEKAADDPVSEADIAVDTLLRERLTSARPDYGWLSEETEDSADRLNRQHVFIADPIDGTRAFIAGQSTWAHSIAIVRNGVPTAGVVYLPARDLLYAAQAAGPATLNGTGLTVAPESGAKIQLLSNKFAMAERYWPGGVPDVERSFRPSLAYRLCLVAEGRFDAMVTLRDSWEWDIAAGALIAERAGCTATDRDGAPLRFNSAHPATPGVIAGSPDAHARLLGYRRAP